MDESGPMATMAGSGHGGLVSPSLSEKLQRNREGLEAELSQIKAAEAILAANPEVKELFDIVSKVRCF